MIRQEEGSNNQVKLPVQLHLHMLILCDNTRAILIQHDPSPATRRLIAIWPRLEDSGCSKFKVVVITQFAELSVYSEG